MYEQFTIPHNDALNVTSWICVEIIDKQHLLILLPQAKKLSILVDFFYISFAEYMQYFWYFI